MSEAVPGPGEQFISCSFIPLSLPFAWTGTAQCFTKLSLVLQVAVSSWVAGESKGHHEVFRTPGEPEVVSPSGDGNL